MRSLPSPLALPLLALSLLALTAACSARPSGTAPVTAPTAASSPWIDEAQLDAALRPALVDEQVPGLSVALLRRNEVRFYHRGHARDGGAAPDEHTPFAVGSITKVFTATLLAAMIEAGEVQADATVQSLLPPAMRVPRGDNGEITLVHLATHRAGLPRMPPAFTPADGEDPYASFTADALATSLAATTLTAAPGARWAYSNYGAGLLGFALAQRSGRPYPEALRVKVLAPLGLDETTATLDAALEARRAQDHDPTGTPVRPWRFDALAGAGAVQSTAADLARFLAVQLQPSGPLAATVERTQTLVADTDEPGHRMGLGWIALPEEHCLFHNGQTGGASAAVAFDRERGVAAAVLMNQSSELHTATVLNLLHVLRGEPVRTPRRTGDDAVSLTDAQRAALVGTYRIAPTFALTIRTSPAGRLLVQATGQRALPCAATAPDRLVIRGVDASITFTLGPDGRATAATLHQGGHDMPAPREP